MVDQASTLKRRVPGSRGKVDKFYHRTSHVTSCGSQKGNLGRLFMGQKVSPTGLRIGVNKDWESKWMAPKKDVAKYLSNDIKIQ